MHAQCLWQTCQLPHKCSMANSILFKFQASFHMTFVLAIGWPTQHVSSWSGLEYVYYYKVQHPILQQ